MKLSGETTSAPKTTKREPINIAPDAKRLLRSLLMEPEMRGVGYSEFIIRAVRVAVCEIERARVDAPGVTVLTAAGRYLATLDE